MSLTAGIIGLPNIGKSTLYNALTNASALVANYAFTTIEPNIGSVSVPDDRLRHIGEIVPIEKTTPTSIEFTDIAGLVKNAHQGEGLGNQFLGHIREVDAIIHVVRCFEDHNIAHVEGTLNPVRDISTVEAELMLSDLDIVNKRLPKIEKKAILKVDREITKEFEVLNTVKEALLAEKPIRSLNLTDYEKGLIRPYGFLTQKPVLYVANILEEAIHKPNSSHVEAVLEYADKLQSEAVKVSCAIEAELAELDQEDKVFYMDELGLTSSGIDDLITKTYQLLGLETFFTTESKWLRAWTFKKGMLAPECAGIIHTDFETGFIRAETIHYDDLINIGSLAKAKELGKIRSEGKTYAVKDGDIITFRFNN